MTHTTEPPTTIHLTPASGHRRPTSRLLAALTTVTLFAAACGDDDAGTTDATAATDSPVATNEPAATEASAATTAESAATSDADSPEPSGDAAGWAVDTADCVDPDAAQAPIEGTVDIAAVAPLSGGPAAAAFSPVAAGFQAYIDYANDNELLAGHELALTVGDDQYDPALTPGVVNSALDAGADLVSGIIGTPNNAAVRDTLNEECIPQLLAVTGAADFGDVAAYPWTTDGLIPYDIEAAAYLEAIAREFPDGATVALFYVNNDFGRAYQETITQLAEQHGLEIVDEQTIDPQDAAAPPVAQLSSIAGNAPDAIVAVPLGAGCSVLATELANAKAEHPGWDPQLYLANTCAFTLILASAGEAADGLYTSAPAGLADFGNPEVVAADPDIAEYFEFMDARDMGDIVTTAAAGWHLGDLTVEILRRAADSPDGLTRASIINAARNLDYTPRLVRDGVLYKTAGEGDPHIAEDVQIVQYDATTTYFDDVGELITSLRSS